MLGSSEFHGGSCPSSLPQCPEGYILVEGDSWGEALSTASDQDIKSCAALCTDLPGECCSFEWSPTERQCNLNRECAPSHEKFQDYLFCVKGAFKHNLLTNNWRKHRLHVSRLDPQRTISSRLFVRKGCLRGPRTDLNWWFIFNYHNFFHWRFFLLSIGFCFIKRQRHPTCSWEGLPFFLCGFRGSLCLMKRKCLSSGDSTIAPGCECSCCQVSGVMFHQIVMIKTKSKSF